MMAWVFISLMNFSEAQLTLKRSTSSEKCITQLKELVDGVTQIQKNKVKKGVSILSELLDLLKESEPLFEPVLTYRAYGLVAIEKYE